MGLAADGLAAGAFEVGDLLIAINGIRLDRASSSPSRAGCLLRAAPAGPLSLRVVRAERAIAENLGLVSPAA